MVDMVFICGQCEHVNTYYGKGGKMRCTFGVPEDWDQFLAACTKNKDGCAFPVIPEKIEDCPMMGPLEKSALNLLAGNEKPKLLKPASYPNPINPE